MSGRGWGLMVLASSVLVFAACSSQSPSGVDSSSGGASSSGTSGGVQVLVEKDVASWALPSDAYNPPSLLLQAYAVDLQATPCLEAAGIDFRMARFDPNAPAPTTETAGGLRLFNQEVAAEFGYRQQMDPRNDWEEEIRNFADTTLNDPSTWDVWNTCRQEGLRALGGDPTQEVYSYGWACA